MLHLLCLCDESFTSALLAHWRVESVGCEGGCEVGCGDGKKDGSGWIETHPRVLTAATQLTLKSRGHGNLLL
eukprot:scaffold238958_cov30-Tisochrysis_lutea.AAC.3